MKKPRIALLHYSAPPVIGGVEMVLQEQARLFAQAGYPVSVVAGRGSKKAMPDGVEYIEIPEMDTQNPEVLKTSAGLANGKVPAHFDSLTGLLYTRLQPVLSSFDRILVHNIFSKHFNIPLSAALLKLVDQGNSSRWFAWCHDLTWTSPHSQSQVHPGYPWDLLRTYYPQITYVAISIERQKQMADLYKCDPRLIRVIYNGVNPSDVLGLSDETLGLARRTGLFESELILLMPVRITQAKNIELAISVTAELRKKGCQVRLIVTGPPDPHDESNMAYYRSLLDLRSQLGVEADVRFAFESGPDPEMPHYLEARTVGELYRLSDLLFMPSHREGFGIPVLEAGLVGIPIFSSDIPAAREIGMDDVMQIPKDPDPTELAEQIITWKDANPVQHLKQRVRNQYSWESIFRGAIEPLLQAG